MTISFFPADPGVSNSNVIASNADYRVQQTPQSGLSLNGSNGRGNSVTVDGGESNDDSGGVRLNVSQDASAGIPDQPQQLFKRNWGSQRRFDQHRHEIRSWTEQTPPSPSTDLLCRFLSGVAVYTK